jgi:hypothetical protein
LVCRIRKCNFQFNREAAYIVTSYNDKEVAEKNPHAIQYLEYKDISGTPIATKWCFGHGKKRDLPKN